jgi:hypothetical protein
MESVEPRSRGPYNVQATTNLTEYDLSAACEIRVVSRGGRDFSSTPRVYMTHRSEGSGTLAQNGVVFDLSSSSGIELVCFRNKKTSSAQFASAYGEAALTAIQVGYASGTRTGGAGPRLPGQKAPGTAAPERRPTNRFENPFVRPTRGHRVG